jgi:cytochrome c peroxidase
VALLFLMRGAATQAVEAQSSVVEPPAEQEPITPIPAVQPGDPLKVALGERLFADPRLSRDGTRACSSCHDTQTNGADATGRATAIDGAALPFTTLTVFNAALSFRLNWEGNYRGLEAEAEATLEGSSMGGRISQAVEKLRADPNFARAFADVYGHGPDRASLVDAIASYERTLVTPGGRFDRWLTGDIAALSSEERRGYRLFKSFGCISCHHGVNVGGNLYERHGIFQPLGSPKPEILRVPSLRNVATRARFFHDGSATTLGEAVRKMAAAQLNRSLSDDQVDSIVAFLQTLTGTYRGAPVTAANP